MSIFSREIKLMKKRPTQYIVFIAVLSAISLVFMIFLHFPVLPGFPYLKLDFADMPVAVAGLMFGPIGVAITAVMKVGLYLLVKGTDSAFIGELSNLICALAFGLSVSLIYHSKESIGSLIMAFIFGVVIEAAVAVFSNWFIILPMYINAGFLPAAEKTAETLFAGIMAFNLIKFSIAAAIGFTLYKAVERVLPFKTEKKRTARPTENPPAAEEAAGGTGTKN